MKRANRIKAESFDRMQYFYRAVHEPLIHARIQFDGHLDETTLKKAVTCSAGVIPLIACCFCPSAWRPHWEPRQFAGEDMVHVVETRTANEQEQFRLLASGIQITAEPQLKIYLVRSPEADTLCILMNHMVCDGAGFKEYLAVLSGLYTKFCSSSEVSPQAGSGSRSAGQLLKGLSITEKIKTACLKYDLSAQKEQALYPLQGDKGNPFFVIRRLQRADLNQIRNYGRQHNATVNDMLLTAYARVLSRKTNQKRIVIPCPVDLRKYLPKIGQQGICNLTSNYICDITIGENDSFSDSLRQTADQMRKQKQSRGSLKSVILLETIFHVLPFWLLQRVFRHLFTIPVLSYSNLGVIDGGKIKFEGSPIKDVFLTGAIKYVPYFQISVSTYEDVLTLSSNLHGTEQDRKSIAEFLQEMEEELCALN